MARPVHFEIPSNDPAKAMAFYERAFGWKFTPWGDPNNPYYLISTGPKDQPGIDGGLMKLRHPNQPCVNTIQVDDIDASTQTIMDAGGLSAVPKMAIPTVGWLAYFKDLDGHIFGIMQNDSAAK